MQTKFYLMSGHSSTGELKNIDRKALDDSGNGNVLVVNLSFNNKEKSRAKKQFFKKYFNELGANNVDFIGEKTLEWQAKKGFEKAGLLYLPGGDTRSLINNLKNKGLVSRLKSFKGIISANSAGAYALCPNYLMIGHGDTEIFPAIGMLDFWIKAHYKPEFDSELIRLSEEKEIFALKDPAAIVYREGFNFIGEVWSFFEDQKTKMSC